MPMNPLTPPVTPAAIEDSHGRGLPGCLASSVRIAVLRHLIIASSTPLTRPRSATPGSMASTRLTGAPA